MVQENITIKGAREHNLKNISVAIPRNKLTVITGLSGSGKSTLAFDTLYAEGQRRYVESLSAYARQFLGLMNKPDVDTIDGLSPAISIEQKTTSKNPRSTVGTITEINDYLRLLFARIGRPHCPECGDEIRAQGTDEMVSKVMRLPEGTKIQILSPVIRKKKGTYEHLLNQFAKKGYTKVRIDGKIQGTDEEIELDKQIRHNIEIIVDRLTIKPESKSRIADSIETALKESKGLVLIEYNGEEMILSKNFACPKCDINLIEFTPRMFSFNSPFGACPDCQGLGIKMDFDPNLVIPNKKLSISGGAIAPWSRHFKSFYMQKLVSICKHYNIPVDVPVENLDKQMMDILFYGSKGEKIKTVYHHKHDDGYWETHTPFEGVINNLRRLHLETQSERRKEDMQKYMREDLC
ncbi:MAG: excinuclease ABC subunit UvrA, partial [Candidatus Aenigmarchaeota archaeon]|nr:excinuclease ABC subunit UvrA [Candidatus Aenigmarchaeota archaeon]